MIDDPLSQLLGEWQVARAFTDHRGALSGTFRGHASVRELPAYGRAQGSGDAERWAVHEEAGVLELAGHRGRATRSAGFAQGPSGRLLLLGAAGEVLTELDLGAGAGSGDHLCRADLYRVTLRLLAPDRIEERWRVRGPDKDYETAAVWTR